MRRETLRDDDNRAVTPLFRVFGGRLKRPQGEAVRVAQATALHRPEWIVLAVLVPGVISVILFDALWRLGGAWVAGLGLVLANNMHFLIYLKWLGVGYLLFMASKVISADPASSGPKCGRRSDCSSSTTR